MSEFYGSANEQENINVLNRALELGCNFWDTAVRIFYIQYIKFYVKKDDHFLLTLKYLKGCVWKRSQ